MKVLLVIFLLTGVRFNQAFAYGDPLPSQILGELHDDRLVDDEDSSEDEDNYDDFFGDLSNFDTTLWKLGKTSPNKLKLNPLRFTNRARCADDSKDPSRSFYLMVDSLNAAKVAYRLALATGNDRKEFTKVAVQKFRGASLELIRLIVRRLLEGSLPLLAHDLDEADDAPKKYLRALENCRQGEYCSSLDLFMAQTWRQKKSFFQDEDSWKRIGRYKKRHFLDPKKLAEEDEEPLSQSCYYLKKNSPLSAHLKGVKPDIATLGAIGQSTLEQDTFMADCFDFKEQTGIEFATYQVDMLGLKKRKWDKIGFDFYNSLKLYFSWAYRYAPEMQALTYPFYDVFRSIHLEDSVMLFSNGCGSLTSPKCDNNFISEQTIRDFAQVDYRRTTRSRDHNKFFPMGSEVDLIKNKTPAINDDILDHGRFPTYEEWMRNFRTNYRVSRGVAKNRFLTAANNMRLITQNISTDKIIENIEKLLGGQFNWPVSAGSTADKQYVKDQFYYLCGEYLIGADETLSFLRQDINLIPQFASLDEVSKQVTDGKIVEYFNFYQDLVPKVLNLCKDLEKRDFWGRNFMVTKGGFKPWYLETLYQGTISASATDPMPIEGRPLLAFQSFYPFNEPQSVICLQGIDCARKVLEGMVDFYKTARYAKLYFGNLQRLSTPSMANPYAERTVCKVYDPWWKVKHAFFNLSADVAGAAATFFNPTPLYLAAGIKPKEVTSLKKMLDDGQLKFDPKWSKNRLLLTLGVDLGALVGAPCTISVSNAGANAISNQYFFAGLTFQGCVGQQTSTMRVYNASDIDHSPKLSLTGCVSCSLNFVDTLGAIGSLSQVPYARTAFYLLRGVFRFFKAMRDPVNVPRSWEVDLNNVMETYRRYGEIPKRCVRKLRRGGYCQDNRCDHAIVSAVKTHYKASVNRIDRKGSRALVSVNQCSRPLKLKKLKRLKLWCKKNVDLDQVATPDECFSEEGEE